MYLVLFYTMCAYTVWFTQIDYTIVYLSHDFNKILCKSRYQFLWQHDNGQCYLFRMLGSHIISIQSNLIATAHDNNRRCNRPSKRDSKCLDVSNGFRSSSLFLLMAYLIQISVSTAVLKNFKFFSCD